MGRALSGDFSIVNPWSPECDEPHVPTLEDLIAGLSAREAAWSNRLAEAQADSDRQAAVFASREAAHAARESALLSRLEERARVIDELTTFLSEITSMRQEEALALEEARRALHVTKSRLSRTRRAARLMAERLAQNDRDAFEPNSSPTT